VGRRWLKVVLLVAVAFALTMSVESLGRLWTHEPDGIDIFWVAFMWPGHLITAFISTHVNIYRWVWTDAVSDPQVVWQWLTIAFNTLFYSGLFWLFSMFVAEARQRAASSAKSSLKPITIRLLLSGATTLTVGVAAVLLHWLGTCWEGGTECPAYSPTKIWIAFLLAPPIYLLQPGSVSNFDPVMETLRWPVLWAYYFGLISAVSWVIRRLRERTGDKSPYRK